MSDTITIISLPHLALSLLPVLVVLVIQYKWALDYKEGGYAMLRMLGQLLVIGYVLGFIFAAEQSWIILAVLAIMLVASSWISLRTVKAKRRALLGKAFLSILIGGGLVLALTTQGVLRLSPWYKPQFTVPLAGMIFAGAMNAISLAADRYFDEIERGQSSVHARRVAFNTALIPMTNALFAVGLVSLPGMMTGQILSGVDPLIAVRYQIMVMAMLYSTVGLSAAMFLTLITRES